MSTTLQRAPKAVDAARRLAGKVALVTGASSGIGEATARELSRLGASVVLVARRQDELERVVDSLRAAGGTAELYAADVTNAVDSQHMVKTAMERFGRLDYAVNNAGMGAVSEFLKVTLEDFDRTTNTNVRSVFLAMRSSIRRASAASRAFRFCQRTSPVSTPSSGLQRVSRSNMRHKAYG